MSILSTNISQAAEILRQGELVAIPTETVYGLAGNIYDEAAVRKIFALKGRPLFNPLIVHIKSIQELPKLAREIPEQAQRLAEAFWPGPLTMVLKKQHGVPDLVTAGKDSVAIRIPRHPVALALLEQLDFPLAAPSANPFGCISPTSAAHVESYFSHSLKMVLDGGECAKGIESTIIGFESGQPVLYRLGSIAVEEIEALIGKIAVKNKKEEAPDAPGMLSKHYAPRTSTFLTTDPAAFIQAHPGQKIGLLLFQHRIDKPGVAAQEILSETGSLAEAATNLYAALHRLDKLGLDMIVAERFPEHGLGNSINDRLERATKK
jgi:L-threonylcarbamoyladenylate synthase